MRKLTCDTKVLRQGNENLKKYNDVLSLELKNSTKENVLELIDELAMRDDVLYAGPDYQISISSTFPNDYIQNNQWAIDSISIPEVWGHITGTNDVVVGIMDTGIDGTHPDLKDSILKSMCRDFTTEDESIINIPTDPNGHGTHVSGIIGAIGNNDVGVTGVNWDVSLVSLRVFDAKGNGYSSNVAKAIKYAEDNNIRIINFSGRWYYSSSTYDIALENIINSYSGLFVCAAGNESIDNDGNNPAYPASYSCNNILSVGAYDSNTNRSDFSNYGLSTVDIYAPGSSIYSTYKNGTYKTLSGTSMSTPYVTGVAALLLSVDSNLSSIQLKSVILNSAEKVQITIPDNSIQKVKKLNAFNAFKYILSSSASFLILKYGDKNIIKNVDAKNSYFTESNAIVRLGVQNAYEYKFEISSMQPIGVKIYDSNFNIINANIIYSNDNCLVNFSKYLSLGGYYLKVFFINQDSLGTININIIGEQHTHVYNNWIYYNRISHIEVCDCGMNGQKTKSHIVRSSDIKNNKAFCIECGYLLDLNFDVAITQANINNYKHSINGSYIMPDGIIILTDEDIDLYLNGTIIFYEKSISERLNDNYRINP